MSQGEPRSDKPETTTEIEPETTTVAADSVATRLLLWPLRHPRLALALTLLLTLGFGAAMTRLRSDVRHEKGFPEDDPRIEVYRAFKDIFGADDETAYVVLEMPGPVLAADAIARVHSLSEAVSELPLVDSRRLESLASSTFVRVTGEQELEIAPLYEPKRREGWDAERLDALLRRHPAFLHRLYSDDGRIAGFLVPLHPSARSGPERRAFARDLKAFFEDALRPGESVHFEGFALTKYDVLALLADDAAVFFPLSLLALLASLFLVFRRLAPVLLATGAVVVSAIWTLGIMALLDIPMTYISTAIPAMILVVCVGDAVYLITRYDQRLMAGVAPPEALEQATRTVGAACLFTSVTTAAGFAALGFSEIEIIRELGIPVAIGVLIDYIVTFLVVPSALALAPTPDPGKAERGHGRLDHALAPLTRVIAARPGAIVAGFGLLLVAACFALPGIEIKSRLFEDLDDDEPLMITRQYFEERMGGACPLELIITARSGEELQPGRIYDPEVQAGLDRLLRRLRSDRFRQLGVLSALGLSDFLIDAHYTINERREAMRRLPDSRGALAELQLLYETAGNDPTRDFVNTPSVAQATTLRVQMRVRNDFTGPFFHLVGEVEKAAAEELPSDLQVSVTGFTLMTQAAHQSLVRGLLKSFAIASLQIFLLILLFFRSLRLALLSLIPNLLPLVLVGAVMALTGIPLKLGTSIVFSIVFGIAVDDTVHFLAAFHHNGGRGRAAVLTTTRRTGAAMVLTSVVLVLGYAVLAASHFRANREFGLLVSLTLGFALLADLVLLPALLLLAEGQSDGEDDPARGDQPPAVSEA